jgi:hypothetical protein
MVLKFYPAEQNAFVDKTSYSEWTVNFTFFIYMIHDVVYSLHTGLMGNYAL